jgi:hypothetical protein
MIKDTYTPHSLDLAAFNVYFFGYVKHCLRGQSFEAADDLFSAVAVVIAFSLFRGFCLIVLSLESRF